MKIQSRSLIIFNVAKVVDLRHSDVATMLRYYVDVFSEDLEEAVEMGEKVI